MTKGMNWDKQRFRGQPTEAARPIEKCSRGAWTHVKQQPVREFTDAEKAQWSAANPALMQVQGKAPAVQSRSYEQWCYRTAVEKVITDIEPSLFLTLVFNCDVSGSTAKAKLREFFFRADRAAIGRKCLKLPEQRARYVAIAENLDTNLHLHVAARLAPEHQEKFVAVIAETWAKLVPSGEVNVQRVWNASGLADYVTKQIRPEEDERIIYSDGERNRLY